jgi:hypothetical protein
VVPTAQAPGLRQENGHLPDAIDPAHRFAFARRFVGVQGFPLDHAFDPVALRFIFFIPMFFQEPLS